MDPYQLLEIKPLQGEFCFGLSSLLLGSFFLLKLYLPLLGQVKSLLCYWTPTNRGRYVINNNNCTHLLIILFSQVMEECAKEQDALLHKMWMRDEVYVQCKIVRMLARTLSQQRHLAQTMEQRVAGMFNIQNNEGTN